jgi:hypothetical protein
LGTKGASAGSYSFVMVGELGRDGTLPLLPAGETIFDALPFGAIVLDALAPAVRNGMITIRNGAREGILVIRDGALSEIVWVADGVRTTGDDALAQIRGDAATVSACRLSAEAMALIAPLIRADPCYADLRLEWVVWPQLLNDLRARGETFVVELATPMGRGVTVIQNGSQIATFGESQLAVEGANLLDELAAGAVGTVRVLIDRGAWSSLQPVPRPASTSGMEAVPVDVEVLQPSRPTVIRADDPNATLSALFGPPADTVQWDPITGIDRRPPRGTTSVASIVPQLKTLAQNRLQRSSGSVEQIVDAAASDHQSVAWLADRVRVMTVRGFMQTTFEQLANEMLALAGSDTG